MGLSNFLKRIGNRLSDKEDRNEGKHPNEDVSQSKADAKENELDSGQGQESTKAVEPSREPVATEKTENEPQIESKEKLIEAVCKLVARYLDDTMPNGNKKLLVWIDAERLIFKTYDTPVFRQQLQSALKNECDITFESVEICIGKPAEDLRCTPVGKSGKVMMLVEEKKDEKNEIHEKAEISIYGNAGSLLRKRYILSSDEMRKKKISAYNIGAGEFPQLPTGYRQNHIAIDDNPNSPMIEKNKYVSRMHAHIGHSDRFGFYLQVEMDGTRLMGKRTRIFRGEQKIELDNPQVKEPLQNGDLIELGKAVVLKYTQICD